MSEYYGDWAVGSVLDYLWNTTAADGSSITRATDGTLKLFKGNGTTPRSSLAGVTQVEDFAGITGVHLIRIDTGDNTDAGFYGAGSMIHVVETAMTIDGKVVNHAIFSFTVEAVGGPIALHRRSRVQFVVGSGADAASIPTSALSPSAVDADQFRGRKAVFDADTLTPGLRGEAVDILEMTSGGVLAVSPMTTVPVSGDTGTIY